MFANLASATGSPTTFTWANIIILLAAVVILYPLQKWLRGSVSKRRKERWAEEDRQAQERMRLQEEQQAQQGPATGSSADPSSGQATGPEDRPDDGS
ncbi:hypothetical protein GCM10027053_45590 [Intrasporangium mesophilum]